MTYSPLNGGGIAPPKNGCGPNPSGDRAAIEQDQEKANSSTGLLHISQLVRAAIRAIDRAAWRRDYARAERAHWTPNGYREGAR